MDSSSQKPYGSLRLFVAVLLGENAVREVGSTISTLSRKRWSVCWETVEKLHFTLFFLGEVAPSSVDVVKGVLGDAVQNIEPFSISLGRVGVFPNFFLPKIVWLGVKGDQKAFIRLQKSVTRMMRQMGFGKEPRVYIPHITIGRVNNDLRYRGRRELGRQLEKLQLGKFHETIFVERIVLYRSILETTGSTYFPICEIHLSR